MSAARRGLVRWLKFNAVGATGIGVQLLVLTILKSGMHVNYLVATVLAVEAAVLNNFFWHERYTWADRKTRVRLQRLVGFSFTNGTISVLGNLAAMKLLAGNWGINYLVANMSSIAFFSLLNFLVSDRFVFAQPQVR
jgi:putative flippase GtrA